MLDAVDQMMKMPRNTTQEVHDVEKYWHGKVEPLQHEVSFFYNIKLAEWLLPEKKKEIQETYTELIQGIDRDIEYVNKLLNGNPDIPEQIRELAEIDREIRENYHPLHWKVAFPHIAVKGGFSVILSNPPWDKIKPNHREFFVDYIDNYKDLETIPAKKAAQAYMESHPLVAKKWNEYQNNIELANKYYTNAYKYQMWKGEDGKTYKGDPNLYKVFLEKIYTILAQGGICGIVIPDNLNIDNGCTGLRHLLLDHSEIKELIMFENRKKLFDIDSRYKFNVLTFIKKTPRANASFDAGFSWYDPIWLEGAPDAEYIAKNEKNKKKYHTKYRYSVPFIKRCNPESYEIFEFKSKALIDIFDKILQYPTIGNSTQNLFLKTFREFDMTLDSDLFNLEGKGWPLFQGKTIHHYNDHLNPIERYVASNAGEERLAKRWKMDKKDLPDRKYRIGWRDIAQPTDTRSLISTVIPRGVFCGNAINQAIIIENDQAVTIPEIISGINAIFSSLIADMYVRQRIAKHVNAFILKSLPVPRNMQIIEELGKMALPLYAGDEYDAFRGEIPPLMDPAAREKLIAKLDARVAIFYGLTYEEYQTVLDTFPLVDDDKKKRCLLAYKDWMFSLS